MKQCPMCGGTGTILTQEARAWLSMSGLEQAKMTPPDSNKRFVSCPICEGKPGHETTTSSELAKLGYEAYGRFTDNKNYLGLPMPAWEDLPVSIQRAWKGAAQAIAERVQSLMPIEDSIWQPAPAPEQASPAQTQAEASSDRQDTDTR